MALTALHSASTGLSALNTQLDVIANNLANVNTPGFKSSRANFDDLLYIEREQPGTENSIGDIRPIGLYVGLGVKVAGTHLNFSQGAPIASERQLDMLIDGEGFFQIAVEPDRAPGGIAYTRTGSFAINSDGDLVLANQQGYRLEPAITIPDDATSLAISTSGEISVIQPGATAPTVVGQIELANFINPAGLKQVGDSLFVDSNATGGPVTGIPGEANFGQLRQNFLEGSNVDPTRELIEMIRTQRAFEMNSQTIRTADEALRTISQLGR